MFLPRKRNLQTLQLDGGCLVFDFINTVNTRKSKPEHDYLKTYQDLLAWSTKVGSLTAPRIRTLRSQAVARPKFAATALRKAISARENLYRLFSKIASGKAPEGTVLASFNRVLSSTLTRLVLNVSSSTASAHFDRDYMSLNEPLHPIIKSAFDVLTQQDFQRIKECPRCGWIFLDTSKNGKRRWCSMRVCGSREKALDYYYRKTKSE